MGRAGFLQVVWGTLLVAATFLLSGCGVAATVSSSPPFSVPTAVPAPTPTPTPVLSFDVVFRPLTKPSVARRVERRVLRRVAVPAGPYLFLSPPSGPPVARPVEVRAGHLPRLTTVRILWSTGWNKPSISRIYRTDAAGRLDGTFQAPASDPGSYTVLVEVHGVPVLSTLYRVVFAPRLDAVVLPNRHGDTVTVTGRHFIPRTTLAILGLPLASQQSKHQPVPFLLGRATTDGSGMLHFTSRSLHLRLGEYAIRILSIDGSTAQSAETFAQVLD